jgi:hypothetical protein
MKIKEEIFRLEKELNKNNEEESNSGGGAESYSQK